MNISGDAKKKMTYDAIVIGSGMSGGWAAKELTEKGLKVLVLERGRNVEHVKDYPTAMQAPWEIDHRGRFSMEFRKENPLLTSFPPVTVENSHFFVKDNEHPYTQVKPFDWARGYQVGGRSLLWARWTQRWSEMDFEANAKDGIAIDWPIRYKDIAPWYSYVERFVGVSGTKEGIPHLPDGEFLPPMEMNCLEKHFQQQLKKHYPNRHFIISRTANLSQAQKIHQGVGRSSCQYRNLCSRGCPYGAYFSSNSATLPAAYATGNLTLRPFSVVHSIIYDDKLGKATGVRVVDANTKEMAEYYANLIFVNAGTINTAHILLHSTSDRFPNGLGNDSGTLGNYLMDHNYRCKFGAEYEGYENSYYSGRRPAGTYLARFRNVGNDKQKDFLRGYAMACWAGRGSWGRGVGMDYFGADFKERLTNPGPWSFGMVGMGEMLPDERNKVTLNYNKLDAWGMPTIEIDCSWGKNEDAMSQDIVAQGAEMMEKAGFKVTRAEDANVNPGHGIHEMGTARMGKDPETSVLNAFNQIHSVKNVFVTDGACMTSSACQNPSLTYMAITARAANHAVEELKKRNL